MSRTGPPSRGCGWSGSPGRRRKPHTRRPVPAPRGSGSGPRRPLIRTDPLSNSTSSSPITAPPGSARRRDRRCTLAPATGRPAGSRTRPSRATPFERARWRIEASPTRVSLGSVVRRPRWRADSATSAPSGTPGTTKRPSGPVRTVRRWGPVPRRVSSRSQDASTCAPTAGRARSPTTRPRTSPARINSKGGRREIDGILGHPDLRHAVNRHRITRRDGPGRHEGRPRRHEALVASVLTGGHGARLRDRHGDAYPRDRLLRALLANHAVHADRAFQRQDDLGRLSRLDVHEPFRATGGPREVATLDGADTVRADGDRGDVEAAVVIGRDVLDVRESNRIAGRGEAGHPERAAADRIRIADQAALEPADGPELDDLGIRRDLPVSEGEILLAVPLGRDAYRPDLFGEEGGDHARGRWHR